MTQSLTGAPEGATEAPAIRTAVLDSLREERAQIGAGSEPLYLPVIGYTRLVAKYHWIPFRDLSRTAQQLSKITEPTVQAIAAAADAIVATCEEICVKVEGEEHPGYPKGLAPLSTDGNPVTFSDPRLAVAMDFADPKNARDMAIRVFNNEYALIETSATVVDWLKDTTKKVDEAFVGE